MFLFVCFVKITNQISVKMVWIQTIICHRNFSVVHTSRVKFFIQPSILSEKLQCLYPAKNNWMIWYKRDFYFWIILWDIQERTTTREEQTIVPFLSCNFPVLCRVFSHICWQFTYTWKKKVNRRWWWSSSSSSNQYLPSGLRKRFIGSVDDFLLNSSWQISRI